MSYTTGTTNYNLPQYVGTDKASWTDTNQPFAALDAAVGGAVGGISTIGAKVESLEDAIYDSETGLSVKVANNTSAITNVEGEVAALNTTVSTLGAQVGDVRTDLEDMITAFKETSATYSRAYAIDEYFIYNDVLYRTTQSVTQGTTIVPNTNCVATNIMTELLDRVIYQTVSVSISPHDAGIGNQTFSITPVDGYDLVGITMKNAAGASTQLYVWQASSNSSIYLTYNSEYTESVAKTVTLILQWKRQ